MTDGSSVDFDILIKCTGFKLNKDVVSITGQDKMHSMGYIDVNLFYTAEPLLDAAQFGSPFGSSYVGGMISSVKMYTPLICNSSKSFSIFFFDLFLNFSKTFG